MAKRSSKAENTAKTSVTKEENIVASEITEASANIQENVDAELKEDIIEKEENTENTEEPEKENPEVQVDVPATKKELVMEAKINIPESLKNAPEYIPSTYVVLTNTSQNRLSLRAHGIEINLEPREIKRDVRRDDLRELLKNKIIQNWFDKGVLSSNIDAEEKTVHEAKAPTALTEAVERHDNGMNISASVKKFEAAGSVDINLL